MDDRFTVGKEYRRDEIFAYRGITAIIRNVVLRLRGGHFGLVLNEKNGYWTDQLSPSNEIAMGVNPRFPDLNRELRFASMHDRRTWMFYHRASARRDYYEFFGEVWCIRQEDRQRKPFLIFARQRPPDLLQISA